MAISRTKKLNNKREREQNVEFTQLFSGGRKHCTSDFVQDSSRHRLPFFLTMHTNLFKEDT